MLGAPTMALLILGVTYIAFFLASWADEVLTMPGQAVGFFEHYGFTVMLISWPLAIASMAVSLARTARIIHAVPDWFPELRKEQIRSEAIHAGSNTLARGSAGRRGLLAIACAIGLSIAVFNAYSTWIDAAGTYNHDVFDSGRHFAAFLVGRSYAFVFWGLVTPVLAVEWFRLLLIGRKLAKLVSEHNPIRLGRLVSYCPCSARMFTRYIVGLLYPVLSLTPVVFALYLTHGITVTLVVGTALAVTSLAVLFGMLCFPYGRAIDGSRVAYLRLLEVHIESCWQRLSVAPAEKGTPGQVGARNGVAEVMCWLEAIRGSSFLPSATKFFDMAKILLGVSSPGIAAVVGAVLHALGV